MKNNDADREVLPIWPSSSVAASLPELKSLKPRSKDFANLSTSSLDLLVEEFKRERNTGVAAELLNVSLLEGDEKNARSAFEFLSNSEHVPASVSSLYKSLLGIGNKYVTSGSSAENEVRKLRKKLRETNDDPLVWVDLSRAYAILGEAERAQNAMLAAMHLCKGHRWISRVAATLFTHLGQPDRAHYNLLKNPNINNDPWLIATELAVSRKAGISTRLWKPAKKIIDASSDSIHFTELASSIATSELLSGASKKAKAYFKKSLVFPNQNTLAQAKWAERKLNVNNIIKIALDSETVANEAKYWEAYKNKEMEKALGFALAWFEEEPYSNMPANAVSFMAALLDKYEVIKDVTAKGLKANPADVTLKINKIYAELSLIDYKNIILHQDTIHDCMRSLKQIATSKNENEMAHAFANIGMLQYRLGKFHEGRDFYERAEKIYAGGLQNHQLIVVVNHLREALISEVPWGIEIAKRAKRLLEEAGYFASPGAEFYFSKLQEKYITQIKHN